MPGRRGHRHTLLLLLGLAAAAGTSHAFVAAPHLRSRGGRGLVTCKAGGPTPSPAAKLRQLLASPPGGDILVMPCCYDGLTARMVEMHGFPLTFMTGFGVSAARGACVCVRRVGWPLGIYTIRLQRVGPDTPPTTTTTIPQFAQGTPTRSW